MLKRRPRWRLGVRPLLEDLVTRDSLARRTVLRHNPEKLARAMMSLALGAAFVKPSKMEKV